MSEILNQFRDEELPLSTVDVSRAMRAGRRRRIRNGLALGGATLAVVVTATTAPLWLSPQPSPSPPTGPTPTCDGSPPPREPSPTWEYFDPLTYEIDTGGVTGFQLGATTTSTYWQLAQLYGDTAVSVALYATGGEPHSLIDEARPVDPTAGEPAEPIDGAPAYWLAPNEPTTLAWEWTPGAWAMVYAAPPEPNEGPTPMSQDDLRAIAMQVARQLELGAGIPVTSPFGLPVPACLYPAVAISLHTSESGPTVPTMFGVGFDAADAAPPTSTAGYTPYLWVIADAHATVDERPSGVTEYPGSRLPGVPDGFTRRGRRLVHPVGVWRVRVRRRDRTAARDRHPGADVGLCGRHISNPHLLSRRRHRPDRLGRPRHPITRPLSPSR